MIAAAIIAVLWCIGAAIYNLAAGNVAWTIIWMLGLVVVCFCASATIGGSGSSRR